MLPDGGYYRTSGRTFFYRSIFGKFMEKAPLPRILVEKFAQVQCLIIYEDTTFLPKGCNQCHVY